MITGIIIQVLKQLVFPDVPRPVEFFGDSFTLQLVHGVKLYKWHSFPSGHTASAFALFFTLAVFSSKDWIKFLCFIFALGVGYSRIYLSQHFLIDITAGSFIAVMVVMVYFTIMQGKNYNWMEASIVRWKIRHRDE
jgi:membrane-associated phospholipid phosphatase